MKKFLLALAGVLMLVQGASAEPVGGATCRAAGVYAYSTHDFDVTLYGAEASLISVRGDTDTDLDLYVYDQFGNLIASDTDATDQCLVAVVPDSTGHFMIRVVNRGNVYNDFSICAL